MRDYVLHLWPVGPVECLVRRCIVAAYESVLRVHDAIHSNSDVGINDLLLMVRAGIS